MIFELATIEVQPGREAEFEQGVSTARPLFAAAVGFHSLMLHRSLERPSRYFLQVGWETVDNHMIDFRDSPAFQEWRSLVGSYFAAPPAVEHIRPLAI